VPGQSHAYTVPERLGLNDWALSGDWTMEEEATTLNAANGQITCRFHARDLNLVMGPPEPGTLSDTASSSTDSHPATHETDIDHDGHGTLTQQWVYQLIRQPGPITDQTFQITFPEPGAHACCFTFG
jgi:hypothetical protein